MTDFNALLSQDADSVVAPPSVPAGTWRMQVLKYDFTKQGKNQTDACSFTLKLLSPEADVDKTELSEFQEFYSGGRDARTTTVNFWLTNESLFRLRDFLTKVCQIDSAGKQIKEMLPESVNCEVLGTWVQQPSKKDPTRMVTFVDGDNLAPVPA